MPGLGPARAVPGDGEPPSGSNGRSDLQRQQDALFWDAASAGWFDTTGRDPSVLLRLKEEYDGAEPAAGSVAVMNLLTFSHLVSRDRRRGRGGRVAAARARCLGRYGHRLGQAARVVPFMLAVAGGVSRGPDASRDRRAPASGGHGGPARARWPGATCRSPSSCRWSRRRAAATRPRPAVGRRRWARLAGAARPTCAEGSRASDPVTDAADLAALLDAARPPRPPVEEWR